MMRGVLVPSGSHKLVYTYYPLCVRVGMWLSRRRAARADGARRALSSRGHNDLSTFARTGTMNGYHAAKTASVRCSIDWTASGWKWPGPIAPNSCTISRPTTSSGWQSGRGDRGVRHVAARQDSGLMSRSSPARPALPPAPMRLYLREYTAAPLRKYGLLSTTCRLMRSPARPLSFTSSDRVL